METIIQWDTTFFLFLNGLRAEWADKFFYIVSQIFTWLPLYLLIIFLLVRKWKRRAWLIVPLFFLMILCTDQTCNLIKRTVCRYRPSHTEELVGKVQLVQKPDGHYYYGGKYGFPSAHAANSAALAFAVFFFLGRGKKWVLPAMIAWSLLLSYSRIYLGVHFPGDILMGFVIGTCWAYLFHLFYFKWADSHIFQKK